MAGRGAGLGSVCCVADIAGQGRVGKAATALDAVGYLTGAGFAGLGESKILGAVLAIRKFTLFRGCVPQVVGVAGGAGQA